MMEYGNIVLNILNSIILYYTTQTFELTPYMCFGLRLNEVSTVTLTN